MILKTLYLKIGDLGLPSEYTYGFLKSTRFICNYIEREILKPRKFEADGFDRISIALCSGPAREPFVNSSKVLCVDLPFNREMYESLKGRELSLFHIDKIKEGLRVLKLSFDLPENEIIEGLGQFVSGGMENRWLYKKKNFASVGLTAFLNCRLTSDIFELRLGVFKEKKLLWDSCILETDPDENAFEYRFKDIQLVDDELVVTSKTRTPLLRLSLSQIGGS